VQVTGAFNLLMYTRAHILEAWEEKQMQTDFTSTYSYITREGDSKRSRSAMRTCRTGGQKLSRVLSVQGRTRTA
jgi:hypothetical protein